MDVLQQSAFWYAFLQLGVLVTFAITAVRAWRHSRARLIELLTAFIFGLLLEQGDIFLFGTYRYNADWVLLGDVPVAIALTWALIIAGAMNITDALGIRDVGTEERGASKAKRETTSLPRNGVTWLMWGLPAPMADAVWAILLDLAIDAVAIRLGLWTWTIRADEGWFGVPWGNFFAWLMVAFWFSFFTRIVRARQVGGMAQGWSRQWLVPFLAFAGLIATLVPFVAIENTSALPFIPDTAQVYNNNVWLIFALVLAVFVGVMGWALLQKRTARERADHWLLLVRLVIHLLFLAALVFTGIYLSAPTLLAVALVMLAADVGLMWHWRSELGDVLRALPGLRKGNAPL